MIYSILYQQNIKIILIIYFKKKIVINNMKIDVKFNKIMMIVEFFAF